MDNRLSEARGKRSLRAAILGGAGTAALAVAVQAALAGAASAQDADVEQVVVTASRVARSGFTAPTPVTTVGAEQIQQRSATTIGEVFASIPSFRPSSSPQTAGVTSRTGGLVSADLRGLGSERTLVLVNGRRFVPQTPEGTVDMKQIPSLLVGQVEVVTGGASAAWGSDAVAGVVNFILKDRIDGIQGNVQYGQSEIGDAIEYRASLAGGGSFFNDKVRFVGGVDYLLNLGAGTQYTRDWGRDEVGIITNGAFAANGQPNFIISPRVRSANQTPGSLIVSGPLKGIAFAPGGTPYQFQFGDVYGTQMIGGTQDGQNGALNSNLSQPIESMNGLTHVDFELNEWVSAFTEFSVAWTRTKGASQESRDAGNRVIQRDNAFLPASIRQQMTALNLTNVTVGRISSDIGKIKLDQTTQTYRGLVGMKGKLGGNWTWDAYYQFGRNRYTLDFGPNNRNQVNFANAIDAVVGPTGQIVCRSTLTSPNNGCIPVNIFGNGSETLNPYVNGKAEFDMNLEQHVAAVNVQGELFPTWAGPVSVAAGAEYRKDSVDAISDPVSRTPQANGSVGGWILGNQLPLKGHVIVKEAYAETVVPLLKDSVLVKALDFNGAVRRTDYSISGGVTTWKVGLTAQADEDVRFRATRSNDIRAPNLTEFFQAGGSSNTSVFDKVVGGTVQVREIQQGNPDLTPEKAKTWTAGMVWQPRFIPRFNFSVDYFNIEVKDVIGSIGAPVAVAGCDAGNALYCTSVRYNANGTIAFVVAQQLNLNALRTQGLDFEAAYTIPAFGGDFQIRGLATYTNELTTVQPGQAVNRVGRMSAHQRITGVPEWRGNVDITYRRDAWSVNLQTRYIGGGLFNPDLTEGRGAANTINDNTVAAYVYFNLGTQYRLDILGKPIELYGLVNNLLDTDPPRLPSGAAGGTNETSTNAAQGYDLIGRAYKVGLRFRF